MAYANQVHRRWGGPGIATTLRKDCFHEQAND